VTNMNIAKTVANMNFEDIPEDIINKPSHYHKSHIDVITFMEANCSREELIGFYRGNCYKYLFRFQDKAGLTDLFKAEFYLKKLIELEKTNESNHPNK
jgi:hypothetical protein